MAERSCYNVKSKANTIDRQSSPGPAPTPLLSAGTFDVRDELGEPGVCGTGGGAMAADA
jgi:hypothetical protein